MKHEYIKTLAALVVLLFAVAVVMQCIYADHRLIASIGSIISIIGAATIIWHTGTLLRLQGQGVATDHSGPRTTMEIAANKIDSNRKNKNREELTKNLYKSLYFGLICTVIGEIVKYILPSVALMIESVH